MRTIASDFPQKILRRFINAYLLIFCRSYAILKSTLHSGSNDENEVIEMDIKAKIDEIVNKVKSDPDIASKFQKDPIKTVEGILGVDLPDDVIKQIVDGVKAKVNVDELKGKLGALGGLFDGR